MITLTGSHANLEGTSTDEKPFDVAINTIMLELDTGNFYFFDEDEEWKLVGYNDGSQSVASLSLGKTGSIMRPVAGLSITQEVSEEPDEIEEAGEETDAE